MHADDPDSSDLVLDTSHLGIEATARIIAHAYRLRFGEAPRPVLHAA